MEGWPIVYGPNMPLTEMNDYNPANLSQTGFPSTGSPAFESPGRPAVAELLGEQRALYMALGEQHADLAALYLGAVTVLRHADNPERIPQAAFSIRELLVKLPKHFDVPMPAHHRERLGDRIDGLKKCWDTVMKNTASRQNGTWTGSIDSHLEKLLTELEGLFKWRDEHHPRRRDEVAALLRKLDPAGGKLPTKLESVNYQEWSGTSDFFNHILHHNRVVNLDEFQAKLMAVERLLLDRLRPRTFADWQSIDDIIREGKVMISDQLVKRALDEMRKNIANCKYFFDQLKSPEWIPHLVSNGLFSDPPAAERTGNTIGFPIWPASQYLVRMAPLAPDEVLKVLLNIPETDNVRVHFDVIEAACSLPPRLAAQWAAKEIAWCEKQDRFYLLLHDDLATLMTHLSRGGETATAIGLARTILSLSPDPRTTTTQDDNAPFRMFPEPRTRFDVWMYKKILDEHVPTLVEKCGMQASSLLVELLESALRLSQRSDDVDSDEDYSFVWRPAIEDHEQNHDHEVKDWLVTAVRDAAARLLPSEGVVVLQSLEQRPYKAFKRLGLHFRREFADLDFAGTAQMMVAPAIFADSGLRHEYYRLLEAHFGRLSGNLQSQYYELVEKGPAWRTEADEQENDKPHTDTIQIAAAVRRWQRDRLWPIREFLDHAWRERLGAIVSEYGEPSHPDFVSYSTGIQHGPNSPKSASDLKEMSVDELVEFLRRFAGESPPGGDIDEPSAEGLARILAAVVAEEPRKYAEEASRFESLDPTYVRALAHGLRDALQQDLVFAWQPVIALCTWAIQQPREIPGRKGGYLDIDPDWGWARKAIADLLSKGLEKNRLTWEMRSDLWGIIEPLTDDPDPIPADESKRGRQGMCPANHSINTTRGGAMHTLIQYALWVRRRIDEMRSRAEPATAGFDDMPEVRTVLERHLDPNLDPSPAIRSVYGQWFPWLVVLDGNWTSEAVPRIFPQQEDLAELRDAAWDSYVTYCPVYNNVFPILAGEYERAISRLAAPPRFQEGLADPQESLAEHLLAMYWRGELDLKEPDGLLAKFYQQASPKLRAHAIAFVGHSIRNTSETIEAVIIVRLCRLWEKRLAACRGTPDKTNAIELIPFGWWFSSGKFSDDSALDQLEQALSIAGMVEPDHLVMERLAAIAGTAHAKVLRCSRLMIDGDTEGWRVYGWAKELRVIFQVALQHGDTATKDMARDLIHRLGAQGRSEYRDLVSLS